MQDEPDNAPLPVAGSVPPVAPESLPLPHIPEIAPGLHAPPGEAAANPAWANDLRQLYNAVVEEPLPDSLIALLSQLDAED